MWLIYRAFQKFIANADPETLAALNSGNSGDVSADMIRTASNMIGKMSPEELQRMFESVSSFQGDNPSFEGGPFGTNYESFRPGSVPSNMTPDMLKTASDMMNKMAPEERQKMFEMASRLRGNDSFSMPSAVNAAGPSSDSGLRGSSVVDETNVGGESSSQSTFSKSRSVPSIPTSTADLQEQMRNQMKDPAMRQVCHAILLTYQTFLFSLSSFSFKHLYKTSFCYDFFPTQLLMQAFKKIVF